MQAAAYAGLDIAAKVVFGWAVMLAHPYMITSQTEGCARSLNRTDLHADAES